MPDVQAPHNKLLRSERVEKTEMVGNASCILSAAAIGPTATGWSKETETVSVFVPAAAELQQQGCPSWKQRSVVLQEREKEGSGVRKSLSLEREGGKE